METSRKKRGLWFLHRANGPWEFTDYSSWKGNGKLYKVNRRTMTRAARNLIKKMTREEIASEIN